MLQCYVVRQTAREQGWQKRRPDRTGLGGRPHVAWQIDKMGHTGRRPQHHHTAFAFNALDTVSNLNYPGATCRALGHSVTTRP
jgi:hypothetical protein